MDFQLSEDQKALQAGIRSFCESRMPNEKLAELAHKNGFDAGLWAELAEMGIFSLRLPESDGGVGLGHADAVLVFAELGRRLVPGPVVWTHLAAGLIKGAAAGEVVVGGLDLMGPESGPLLVEHLDSLDALLILRHQGVYHVDPKSLSARPIAEPLDPLTPLHHMEALPEGELIVGPDEAERLRLEGAALVSGQLLGIAESTLELAAGYAKERHQFGRAIGSFQAIKHMLADMFVRQEVARAAVYAAGATLDDPEVGDVVRAVSTGKITAGEGALKNARSCIQIHGGMGFTWEIPAHLYMKRTWVLESVFGRIEEHEGRCAELVERSL